ncbi:MAG: tRNA-dihydrouridine synthase family protein [Planctomycetes bacterium]|nr:tRNA-dihydrouridine synthase family protein [Planctomycetota bacterium]MBI3833275.1 tRNA-dihydrouridine synthase family protein [Planctomycetota bacterium]
MLQLGSITIEVPFVQAALSGYSDLPMRRLARCFGATYTLNEVMLDKLVVQPGKHRREMLSVTADDHPVGGQLMGADPVVFAQAAFDLAQAGYDVIDINFGCPVKKVLGRCRGGFLLSEPKTAIEIVKRVYDAVGATHPVTAKMRRGMDDEQESEHNFFTILDAALAIGVSAVTVHGRTVEQRYVGPSRWEFLSQVKRHVGDIPILGSGDLFTAEDCIRMMEITGVDGVTIARGCIGNPWIFEECLALQRGDALPEPPSIAAQREGILIHWYDALEVYGRDSAHKIMRKFGIKYSEMHPSHLDVRDAFIRARSAEEFEDVLDQWYDPSVDWPPVSRRTSPGDLIAAGATLCDVE